MQIMKILKMEKNSTVNNIANNIEKNDICQNMINLNPYG